MRTIKMAPAHDQREKDLARSRQVRMVSIVVAATMVIWLLAQQVGAQYGLEPRYAFLFDFAALAALVWALVVIFQIWRASRG